MNVLAHNKSLPVVHLADREQEELHQKHMEKLSQDIQRTQALFSLAQARSGLGLKAYPARQPDFDSMYRMYARLYDEPPGGKTAQELCEAAGSALAYLRDREAEAMRNCKKPEQSSRYEDRYPFCRQLRYQRGRGRMFLEVPIGYLEDDSTFCCRLGGFNSHGFLNGLTGVGKTSVLHMIISGVVRNYHPDDVELWLVDLKMTEFQTYVDHRPPHVRCILQDGAPECCYSFIDRLDEELCRRNRIFSQNGWKDMDDVPLTVHMPAILAIIDEFDILSDALANLSGDTYRTKLERLLSKGRQRGFHFLFSTQSYSTGIAGLTRKAKLNLGVRMAMHSPDPQEIEDTLGVARAALSDEIKAAIADLPPYQLLYKELGTQGQTVRHVRNFYVDGDTWKQQHAWLDRIGKAMRPGIRGICGYVDKGWMVVNGISGAPFSSAVPALRRCVAERPGTLLLAPGVARALGAVAPVTLTRELGENMLFFCNGDQAPEGARVLRSCLASAKLCGYAAEVWAPGSCRYISSNDARKMDAEFRDQPEELERHIHGLRRVVEQGACGRRLIVIADLPALLKSIPKAQENPGGNTGLTLAQRQEMLCSGLSPREIARQQCGSRPGSGSFREDLEYLLNRGPAAGCHFLIHSTGLRALKGSGIPAAQFNHLLAFRMKRLDAEGHLYSRQLTGLEDENAFYTDGDAVRLYLPYK